MSARADSRRRASYKAGKRYPRERDEQRHIPPVTKPDGVPAKSIHLLPPPSAVKRLCFDETTRTLRPNMVLVDRRGAIVFEINELGLKGAARDPARKLAVIWGDSVVFGIGWSWPCLIDEMAAGYQVLNGGIEADPYDNILRRAEAFNHAHAVALNIVMLGWHPWHLPAAFAQPASGSEGPLRRLTQMFRPSPREPHMPPIPADPDPQPIHRRLRVDLVEFLQHIPNTVLVTMPTALNQQIADRDLSPCFTQGGRDTVFTFAGDLAYSMEAQRHMLAHITERNAIVRAVAQASGVRLVDLAAAFDTAAAADFREDFHDMLHLRPRAYPKAAAIVYEGIKDLL
jgi:lysophospholipase L1-like esterase